MPCCPLHSLGAINTAMSVRKGAELLECSVKESDAAAKGTALHVVVSSGELNQPLQKALLVTRGDEPDPLPCLVGVPELLLIEERKALLERTMINE